MFLLIYAIDVASYADDNTPYSIEKIQRKLENNYRRSESNFLIGYMKMAWSQPRQMSLSVKAWKKHNVFTTRWHNKKLRFSKTSSCNKWRKTEFWWRCYQPV